MADKPILFSGEMVRAILEGRKTQTRRVLKPQPKHGFKPWQCEDTGLWWQSGYGEAGDDAFEVPLAKGDRLWVRETWSGEHWLSDVKPSERFLCPNESRLVPLIPETWYWADGGPEFGDWERPRPSIFMPRWASRLTLPVSNVKVERAAAISEDDTKLEGWPGPSPMQEHYPADVHRDAARDWFMDLWDSINAAPKPRYAVADGMKQITHYESFPFSGESRTETFRGKPHIITANPRVAAYTFETHHCNIDEMAETSAND